VRDFILAAGCGRPIDTTGLASALLLTALSSSLVAMPALCSATDPPNADGATAQSPAPQPVAPQVAETTAATPPSSAWSRWFNPSSAPFIPVPEIGVDPDGGTTLGLIPTWIKTDEQHEIRQILAPDVLYTPYFGVGAHARLYEYPSEDEQYSVVAGIKERVERGLDFEYQGGRSRSSLWSITGSLNYDVNGTPRFYGIGNESPAINETNYTNRQELAQLQAGLNLTHNWQVQYTGRYQIVDVLPGTLASIANLETRFGRILGVGINDEVLNRVSLIYDTRDNLTVPRSGVEWIAYGGLASRTGILNDSMDSEAGTDGRAFWPIDTDTTVASHMALRYLLSAHRVPFWGLSGLGGAASVMGGEQPLRGYGDGRFYDRDSFSTSVELRHRVSTFNAVSTRVDLEVTPFIDVGRVFSREDTVPVTQLHHVYGMGFRGVARPFVVGYVDIGYGSEGVAVFTGLNYPF